MVSQCAKLIVYLFPWSDLNLRGSNRKIFRTMGNMFNEVEIL